MRKEGKKEGKEEVREGEGKGRKGRGREEGGLTHSWLEINGLKSTSITLYLKTILSVLQLSKLDMEG